MQLGRIAELKYKRFWLFIAYKEDNPHESVLCLCKSREEADKLMDKYLPSNSQLQKIQKKHSSIMIKEHKFEPLPRKKLMELGFFFNPFSNEDSEYYNGYYTFYAVKPLEVNTETLLHLERET